MTTENPHLHMPDAPGQEPWTAAERLYRQEALHMELEPPAGLEEQVFGALGQPVRVSPKKTSWRVGGAAVVAAVALTWWALPSDGGHVPSPATPMETADVPAVIESETFVPSEMPVDVRELESAPPKKVANDHEVSAQGAGHVSALEALDALDASEVPAVDDLNTDRGLSVKDRSPQQEVRKAKVEVHSEH